MAHYDCSDCGYGMGIAFGYCVNCTPKEYFDLKEKIYELSREAEREWLLKSEDIRNEFINAFEKSLGLDNLRQQLKDIEQQNKR